MPNRVKRVAFGLLVLPVCSSALHAQASATAPAGAQQASGQTSASVRQLGTVKSVSGATLTLTTSAGADVTVSVAAAARILQLAPGTTDLKSATPAKLEDV